MSKFTDDLEIIHAYTRRDAIEDGVLVDVSAAAAEAGFRFPVALTRAVFEGYVAASPLPEGQDVSGRLWDLLNVLRVEIRRAPRGSHRVPFQVAFRMPKGKVTVVSLVVVCGPGDEFEPVLTVMEPGEE